MFLVILTFTVMLKDIFQGNGIPPRDYGTHYFFRGGCFFCPRVWFSSSCHFWIHLIALRCCFSLLQLAFVWTNFDPAKNSIMYFQFIPITFTVSFCDLSLIRLFSVSITRQKSRLSHVNAFFLHYVGQLKTAVEQEVGEILITAKWKGNKKIKMPIFCPVFNCSNCANR